MMWQPEMDYEINKAAATGFSARIAADRLTKKFGRTFTRSAVLGRAYRLHIKFNGDNNNRFGESHERRD